MDPLAGSTVTPTTSPAATPDTMTGAVIPRRGAGSMPAARGPARPHQPQLVALPGGQRRQPRGGEHERVIAVRHDRVALPPATALADIIVASGAFSTAAIARLCACSWLSSAGCG